MSDTKILVDRIGTITKDLGQSKDPKIILLFLMEELGEVARAYLKEEGHKKGNDRVTETFRQELGTFFICSCASPGPQILIWKRNSLKQKRSCRKLHGHQHNPSFCYNTRYVRMAEWTIATVCKTVALTGYPGSNPGPDTHESIFIRIGIFSSCCDWRICRSEIFLQTARRVSTI